MDVTIRDLILVRPEQPLENVYAPEGTHTHTQRLNILISFKDLVFLVLTIEENKNEII